ncbi:MAG TPA: DUF167 family protein [Aggregatilinea sp.]|uniref:DUF167 domain-containing protein n=1 Tax=Aggregatilinea sp. TaxID=2806333 RepID=UPI002C4D2A02|nr:DUF167 family protein [Aggregatilinea sp.]HML21045.1 DUF167 family protein [Aggregatilinea sp.]
MPREFNITDAKRGAAFAVMVIDAADEIGVVGVLQDRSIQISLTEPLAGGYADAQLIKFLASVLDVHPSQITIVAGENQPKKIISVDGISPSWIDERLLA